MIPSTHAGKTPVLSLAALLSTAIVLIATAPSRACFSIIVGKNASVDGCVLVAHNEDDSPPQVVNHHKIPRRTYPTGEKVVLRHGGQLDQVPQTWSYLWSEMPEADFSDSYVNEWGVCVTSDNCPSRETQGELTDGGIGYMLRRLVAERARTAREGVRIAADLVERFGYIASGRTYIIADPQEGWLLCVIQGKHWLARRIADDEVAVIANTFTVREVDIADSENVLASNDILTHAVQHGWYHPEEDKPFDFAAVYSDRKAAANPVNYGRQSAGLCYVAISPLSIGYPPPFSVRPSKKLSIPDLTRILRHNGSGSSIRTVGGQQVVCNTAEAICRGSTQTSFVARLSTQPSRDLGIVYWVCLSAPETSVFIPFPFGITDFPSDYRAEAERPSLKLFEQKLTSPFPPQPLQAFWAFSAFRHQAQSLPESTKARILAEAERIEAQALRGLETTTDSRPASSSDSPTNFLESPAREAYQSALKMMESISVPQ